MKTLRVIQNSVGRYNLLSNEESLCFSMGLFDDDKLMSDGETKAKLYYSGDPDEKYGFEDAINNLDFVFEKCFEY